MTDRTDDPGLAAGFAAFVDDWNGLQGLITPDHHRRIATWLEARWRHCDRRLLLMAFRGAGKSTLVGLFCAWLLMLDPSLRILVLAAEQALARKMVRLTKRLIERHPATAALMPQDRDEWAADRFTVARAVELRDPSMLARGVAANITGCRAEIVICDDVEVRNTADTAAKRTALRDRLGEIDYVLVPQGTALYVGTPHARDTIYATETGGAAEAGSEPPYLDGYLALRLPLVDADGASAWPERFDAARIAELRRRQGPRRFASQMQLDPAADAACRLDPRLLVVYREEMEMRTANERLDRRLRGRAVHTAVVAWDPARGTEAGDGSVAALVLIDADDVACIHRIVWLNAAGERRDDVPPPGLKAQSERVAALARDYGAGAVLVEANGIGEGGHQILAGMLQEGRLHIPVLRVVNTGAKTRRILDAFDARLAAGLLHIHQSVLATRFPAEMRDWLPGASGQRDDGLDAVATALANHPIRARDAQGRLRTPFAGRRAYAPPPLAFDP
jgi:hypothetical protein